MATKNIARSAIEGGRANTWSRRYTNRQARARERQWLSRVMEDPEVAEDSFPKPRLWEPKEFTDKLNPLWRWLESKVGKPWDETHSLLRSKFDDRKISGHHILHDHMLQEVGPYEGYAPFGLFGYSSPTAFYVDGDGILRKYHSAWPWRSLRRGRIHRTPEWEVTAFVGNRMVIDYDTVQFWAIPADGCGWRSCRHREMSGRYRWPSRFCHSVHRRAADNRDVECYGITTWRQDRRFTDEEARIWSKMNSLDMERKFILNADK